MLGSPELQLQVGARYTSSRAHETGRTTGVLGCIRDCDYNDALSTRGSRSEAPGPLPKFFPMPWAYERRGGCGGTAPS
jgi:hypothetical protein